MDYTPYDYTTLAAVYNRQRSITPFWLNFYTNQINFETKYIDFEEISDDYRKMAPFVAPNVKGRVITLEGSNLKRFAPAYVKPKYAITPQMAFTRRPGDPLSVVAAPSLQTRKDAMVAELTARIKARMANRNEWLAAKALIDGKVTIAGADYPTRTVDFNRDPSLSVTLVGAAKWDQDGADPLASITNVRRQANNLSGAKIKRLIFGSNAWALFCARMKFNTPQPGGLLDTQFRGSDTSISRLLDGYEGAEYAGTVTGLNGQGTIECWVYSGTIIDNDFEGNTVEQQLLDTNTVVGVGDGLNGFRCFGAIQDFDNLVATEVFLKTYRESDPSQEFMVGQSAPLMVPGSPNNSFTLKVA